MVVEEHPPVSAGELQARLALRSLCHRSFGPGGKGEAERPSGGEGDAHAEAEAAGAHEDEHHDDHAPSGISLFQKKLCAEMEEVLKSGLARRMERLTSHLHTIANSDSNGAKAGAADEPIADDPKLKPLHDALAKALRSADEFAKAPELVYGPTFRQRRFTDPPEQHTMDVVQENSAMKVTLGNLQQNVLKREKQIACLQTQIETAQAYHKDQVKDSEKLGFSASGAAPEGDCSMMDDAALAKFHADSVARRREHVDELAKELTRMKAQASYYQDVHKQQQKYIRSIDQPTVHYNVFRETGGGFQQHLTRRSRTLPEQRRKMEYVPRLARHPAGEVFLEPPPPPPVGDDKLEVWNVGCSVANPYVVDSWPFEPNVQAQRAPEDPFMPALTEETKEDLEDELRGFRNPFRAGARLSRDEDDMPSTSRSL